MLIEPGRHTARFKEHAVWLKGGRFEIGTRDHILPEDGERPPRKVRVAQFGISATCVSNAEFAAFIKETGYRTDAERLGWSFVFDPQMREGDVPGTPWWWRRVGGATWHAPYGGGSSTEGLEDHPVTHVSWNDANAFAGWAGGRLPTEAEWEFAASGGIPGQRFPWGEREPDDIDFFPCNIWQGEFPSLNTAGDGFRKTAPVKAFEPNAFGLYNLSGNVWEWTADVFRIRSLSKSKLSRARQNFGDTRNYVLKGGSFLCHRSYCYRYRIAARSANTPDSSSCHMGLRIAFDPD